MRFFVLIAFWLLASSCRESNAVSDEPEIDPIVIGESLSLESTVYGSEQRISVHLPDGYELGDDLYPVVYATHSRFPHLAATVEDLSGAQIPPSILVYLETYDSGDLIPTPVPSRPGSGQADRLARFFSNELIPFIDQRYRTHPFRVFHSGSWGGVFCLHTILSHPSVFQGCVAATPWVILKTTGSSLREAPFRHNCLFIALGNDPDEGLREGVEALADTVTTIGPDGLEFEYRYLPEEDHFSIGHKAFFDGLRWVFRDWARIPQRVLEGGPTAIEAYLLRMEEKFGFPIGAHWGGPYSRGFEFLEEGHSREALEMFRVCAGLAAVPACQTGMGRAHELAGDLQKAREAYQRALELATEQGFADLDRFRDAVERVSGENREAGEGTQSPLP